jgi:type VI secretion system protein VasI
MPQICPACRGEITPGARFCQYCGASQDTPAAAAPSREAPREGIFLRTLNFGCWGCLGLLALVAVAWFIGDAVSDGSPRTESATAASTQSAATSAAPTPAGPPAPQTKWQVSHGRSPMDDSPSVTLTLEAENRISGWLQNETPRLQIRCRENKTDLYVWTGMAANPELGLYNEHTVRIRVDATTPTTQRWSQSTNNEALFAPQPIALARRLVAGERLVFEFTPFNAGRAVAEFDIRGLRPGLREVATTCKWSL